MSDNEFSVYWWDPQDTYHEELRFVSVKDAMERAFSLTTRPAATMGIIRQVMITDGGDCCVFQWFHDKGVVFPPPTKEEMQ